MATFFAFGVNVANLGGVSKPRIPASEWIPQINSNLEQQSSATRIVVSYRHTGNFVVSSNNRSLTSLAKTLTEAVGAECAVCGFEELTAFVYQIRHMDLPPAEPGIRWTPGGIFLVTDSPNKTLLKPTDRAKFRLIANGFIAAWKRDNLDSVGRLDRARRNGGWGGLSTDVKKQLGGTWTARSITTLEGLLKRAKDADLCRSKS